MKNSFCPSLFATTLALLSVTPALAAQVFVGDPISGETIFVTEVSFDARIAALRHNVGDELAEHGIHHSPRGPSSLQRNQRTNARRASVDTMRGVVLAMTPSMGKAFKMHRQMHKHLISASLATFLLAQSPALAQTNVAEPVIAKIQAEGYTVTNVRRSWLGRTVITAVKGEDLREVVLNRTSGAILRDHRFPNDDPDTNGSTKPPNASNGSPKPDASGKPNAGERPNGGGNGKPDGGRSGGPNGGNSDGNSDGGNSRDGDSGGKG